MFQEKWAPIHINLQNIERETEKAILIKLPHKSDYDGLSFWFPKKLVKKGNHSYDIVILMSEDFKVNARRYGKKGRLLYEEELKRIDIYNAFNRCRIDEEVLDAE